MKRALKISFVDDMPENLQAWLRSFPETLHRHHQFSTFLSVEAVIAAFESGHRPDILFVDYYIGKRFGHEVVDYFLKQGNRPLLIAHSSMERANQVMLRQGADLSLAKVPGAPFTDSIVELIRTETDLFELLASFGR